MASGEPFPLEFRIRIMWADATLKKLDEEVVTTVSDKRDTA